MTTKTAITLTSPTRTQTFNQSTIKLGKLASSHFLLDDPDASRIHAIIEVDINITGRVYVIDMSSLNGTFVNGKKVTKATLADGDTMTIGSTKITVGIVAPPTATDDDITEDTIDRPVVTATTNPDEMAQAAATEADRLLRHLRERTAERVATRAATRAERLKKRAECDADRTLAVALLYEAVHRAEAFAHEVVLTERMLVKLTALAEAGHDVAESIALLEARHELAEEALPALLDIRAHRQRLLEIAALACDLEEPSTEELWTVGTAGALAVSPYLLQWASVIAKAETAVVAVDPGNDPIPAGPTP